jgi:hypothetical protein
VAPFRLTPIAEKSPLEDDVSFPAIYPSISVFPLNWGQLFANGRRPFWHRLARLHEERGDSCNARNVWAPERRHDYEDIWLKNQPVFGR